ncbi:hypothetical protein Tco_0905592 [Tanacetum coccineum]
MGTGMEVDEVIEEEESEFETDDEVEEILEDEDRRRKMGENLHFLVVHELRIFLVLFELAIFVVSEFALLSITARSISNIFDTTLSMTTLADKSLLSGGDNKPPMLEKHLYDSWKSIMELYIMNRPHGRMILASVEKGPLVCPTITVDGVTRPKEYTELTPVKTSQADCNIKAINIILQGLPTEIYALVSQHRVAKDNWEKIKPLMQGKLV